MALGIKTSMNEGDGSDFLPIIKYMAEAGRLYKIDRIGGSNGFENVPTELPTGTRMIFDFGGISVGWLHFAAGMAPSMTLVPVGKPMPPAPDKQHRQGFRMLVMTADKVVREFATTAKTVLGAMDSLHAEFEAATEAAKGQIPVVQFIATTPLKRNYKDPTSGTQGSKTTFVPAFKITSWVDRAAAFGARTVPPPASKGTNGRVPAKATTPASVQAPEPPPNDDEWGTAPPPSQARVPVPAGGGSIDDDIPFAPPWQ